MNTKNLKAYAPKARSQFIDAVKKRAAHFGIYEDRIEEVRIEGSYESGAAIIEGRAFTRKEGEQRKRLESKVTERGYDMFIREMAYTWFNRLAALRYMEIHDYFDHGFRVLSHPTNPDSLPEVLSHASDVADSLDLDKSHIIELQLAGDKEEELYRELLLGQCHQLAKIMPFVFKGIGFEAIDDATELLLPNNLTKTDSILKGLINDIPEEDWQEIEVIGWLYQFYISEHKDAVIGKVVKSEDIPAATQLFTPNWIVKYLVQNSVGRQWLATYPDSELKGKMEYYIEPAEQSEEVIEQLKAITPTSIDPEEIKVLDPACGSGHILVEVYEVLREIYLERGYRLREIPELILTKNIYGLDIDDRAAQLAGFALMMKAREDDRRIFQRVEDGEVSLNVFSLQSTEHLDIPKLWKALDLEGIQQTGSTGGLFDISDEFVQPTGVYKEYFELLQTLKSAFLQAKTLGSLISIANHNLNVLYVLRVELDKIIKSEDPAAKQAARKIIPIVQQSILLAQKYDSVIANPPYLAFKAFNSSLKTFSVENFSNVNKDLFSMFMCKNLEMAKDNGFMGVMTSFVWMFISTFEELRVHLLSKSKIDSLIQLHYDGFSEAKAHIMNCVFQKNTFFDYKGTYIRLAEIPGVENQAPKTLEAINNRGCGWLYETSQVGFENLPGRPIAYWASSSVIELFKTGELIGNKIPVKKGMDTGNNERFLRVWHEIAIDRFVVNCRSEEELDSKNKKWIPYDKGGYFRKWYGNNEFVLNWENSGHELKSSTANLRSKELYFKKSVTWCALTSTATSARYSEHGSAFDSAGSSMFPPEDEINIYLALVNSSVIDDVLKILNPTLNYGAGSIGNIPIKNKAQLAECSPLVEELIEIYKDDWDSSEISWDFDLNQSKVYHLHTNLEKSFELLEQQNKLINERATHLEEKCNHIVKESLGVESSGNDLPIVSLRTNCDFVFGQKKERKHRELYRTAIIKEIISNAIGLMMGRYSLDAKGIAFAHSDLNVYKSLLADGAYEAFPADDDGIIPLASEEWLFYDDATTRFKEFVKTVWGNEHVSENLEFVAESLCLNALKPKKGEGAMDTIRRYFSTQFFKDHCKTYKKRPIYWLFSSGKEKAFECLVYLHRYNEGTLSRMRTEYVTPLMGKYDAQHTLLTEQQLQATGTEARRIEKELKSLEKKQAELRTFDEQLKHYAEMRITLDLDDGVKANYGKFGNLLADVKVIHGKAVK